MIYSLNILIKTGQSGSLRACRLCRQMATMIADDYSRYQKSLDKLNQLQMIPSGKTNGQQDLIRQRLTFTRNMCEKLKLKSDDINRLNIIHITGTKGKGSTSAFIESILRHSGYKTGLFTSPHLIEVKERIKVNGVSLSYVKFQQYFDHCFEQLFEKKSKDDMFDTPSYFQFLTCMMLYTFCQEGVEAAVIEVGIGGEYDNTNIIDKPVACGITSLGLDHCAILGNTLEEIAWQKSGIFKPSSVAFVLEQDSSSVLKVIRDRAKERNAQLCIVPTVSQYYDSNQNELHIGLNGKVQYINSSLALQITKYWIDRLNTKNFDQLRWIEENTQDKTIDGVSILRPLSVLDSVLKTSLTCCKWPGRNQVIETENQRVTYYLDGAHTTESIEQFIDWFMSVKKTHSGNEKNVLLFNYTGDRDPAKFLKILSTVNFESIALSKLEAYPKTSSSQMLDNVRKMPSAALDTDSKYISLLNLCQSVSKTNTNWRNVKCELFDNVQDSLIWLTESKDSSLTNKHMVDGELTSDNNQRINVLITGSLYLVGLALKVLDYKID